MFIMNFHEENKTEIESCMFSQYGTGVVVGACGVRRKVNLF